MWLYIDKEEIGRAHTIIKYWPDGVSMKINFHDGGPGKEGITAQQSS